MKTNTQKILSLTIAGITLSGACTPDKHKNKQADAKSDTTIRSPAKSPYVTVNTWLDDFRNFRTAVYQNDVQKLKTYFSFPVNADTTQVCNIVYDNADDSKRPETYPGTFTERDFEKHHRAVFTHAFIKSLLKVKSEQLAQKGEYTTPKVKESYVMIANYDKANATLQLSVSYSGDTDENGNYVSESEYAVIYFFKVQNNKFLKFDKILFAG
ncbi:hypothetical protein HH214_16295 [Mucilaginibacter robiniae]|uniref:Lipoprotein n=1 Tax=Mucilaginibacter robiniae TaxID=2728022 RepID=A0A7L5E4K6_9SPHI|nr:hypothetical protein [Mucilaginibacter robiniae]QJD97317.1 hypothetical protein HH214_16295 [Mucilaginibacter robiniae]